MPQAPTVRKALYVLFARLFAGPPDAELYGRLANGGLRDLARVQGIDLDSDLVDGGDAEGCATELSAEFARWNEQVSLRASEFASASEDPVVALGAYLQEHRLRVDSGSDLPADHLSVVLGIMGELAAQEEAEPGGDAGVRARAFFLRHIQPWAQQALAEVAGSASRNFYRGVAAMLSAFLGSELSRYRDEA